VTIAQPAIELDTAVEAEIRRRGGVLGALMTCDDRLRAQLAETRETVLCLRGLLDDQAAVLAQLRQVVSDQARTIVAQQAQLAEHGQALLAMADLVEA
jgi:hypothetical protein